MFEAVRYGEDWHLAGKLLNKPNYLERFHRLRGISNQSEIHLAVPPGNPGGKRSGITIGASITSRPELFAVAIDGVPMSDVVRAEFTPMALQTFLNLGRLKKQTASKALYEMSGYHQ